MGVFLQVIDLSTNNVVEDFDSELETLSLPNVVFGADGVARLSDLVLVRFEDGHPTLIASRNALVQRISDALT
jgi:hypothetical protein